MKPNTHRCIRHEKLTSTGTSDVKTADIPNGTSMISITTETNPGRMTWEGSDPSLGVGHIHPNGAPAYHLVIGQGAIFKWVSTVAGNSVAQLSYLQ